MLHLTCIKDFSQSRRVYQSILGFDIKVNDDVVLSKATNLPDSDNLYWLISINDDDSYGQDCYGYLVELDSNELANYFE